MSRRKAAGDMDAFVVVCGCANSRDESTPTETDFKDDIVRYCVLCFPKVIAEARSPRSESGERGFEEVGSPEFVVAEAR